MDAQNGHVSSSPRARGAPVPTGWLLTSASAPGPSLSTNGSRSGWSTLSLVTSRLSRKTARPMRITSLPDGRGSGRARDRTNAAAVATTTAYVAMIGPYDARGRWAISAGRPLGVGVGVSSGRAGLPEPVTAGPWGAAAGW